ncbi:Ccdc189 [Symbiodinium natans]|uniref:Ccdc189 protein n=1 Tax=Symbiodinium natans TaxID=878477 RepID=A0A812PXJ0_9DINO|nr:Ccdc189 [Symbiodinium natans]
MAIATTNEELSAQRLIKSSKSFPPEKTSTLLSIMKIVLEDAVRLRLNPDDAFGLFQDWLLKHAVERPPRSVGIFSFDDVTSIVEYVANSFFRHYRLYMYAFTTKCDVFLRVGEPLGGATPPLRDPAPMTLDCEVDPLTQPELAHLFRPSEQEMAEAEMRRIRSKQEPEDEQAALIKQRVEEGVKRLVEQFEEKLREQVDDVMRRFSRAGWKEYHMHACFDLGNASRQQAK